MNKDDCRKKACQVLRRRARFENASIALPTTQFPGDDTQAIREATRLYVESWIVPLLDAIESEDYSVVKRFYEREPGHKLGSERGDADRIVI